MIRKRGAKRDAVRGMTDCGRIMQTMFTKPIVHGPMRRKCDVSLTAIQGMIGWSHKTLTLFMKPLDDYIKGCSDMPG